ncbi:hypothetical protein HMPREF0578_0927 [Mobiluncus mulieris 28-1]|uniref:hypothetical protein n=1 Tax=Mobiluncus mulieris TaxID=2052 RepID=UPI0001BE7F44|nr:hypothetical protein [Mobiluncus mulieris]EEZ91610.1 hypothetical protein HMPREF0578_0927 [Mobiluncus mulieris 28-1]MCU9972128.1 hypothetical protein [Mobiluncus mulieris]NMW90732.1 hypothetical protein [Mobiluncus mulieris]
MPKNTPEIREEYERLLTYPERAYLNLEAWPWLPELEQYEERLAWFHEAFTSEDSTPEQVEALAAYVSGDNDTWLIKNHMNKFMDRFMALETDYSDYYENEDVDKGAGEPEYLDEVLADALDVEYRLDAGFKMTSVLVTLELGGPNMYLDTKRREMICTWGGSREVRLVPMELVAEVDNYFGEHAAGVGQISYESWHPMDTRTQRGTPQPHQPALTPVGPSVEM